MIAILLACLIGGAAGFTALIHHGLLIALIGASFGGSILAGATGVFLAVRAAGVRTRARAQTRADRSPGAPAGPLIRRPDGA